MEDLLVHNAVGAAFALALLVADDVTLVGELGAVQRVEQKSHAVAFKPQGRLQLVGGDGLKVIGAVKVGGAVDVRGAGGLKVLDVRLLAHMLGALEHHVLEEVRETGAARALLHWPHVIPDVDGDDRELVIFVQEDLEAVAQLVIARSESPARGWNARPKRARAWEPGPRAMRNWLEWRE